MKPYRLNKQNNRSLNSTEIRHNYQSDDKATMPVWATALHTHANLYQVDDKLFRSEQLGVDEAVLLTKYRIDAVINLRFIVRKNNERQFAPLPELKSVAFYNCPLRPWHVSTERIAEILWQIRSLQNLDKSVLVHCLHGADRTGIVIAMYRIVLQGWSIEHAKNEMIRGNFGYHVIWRNLKSMLNAVEVDAVHEAYINLQRTNTLSNRASNRLSDMASPKASNRILNRASNKIQRQLSKLK